LHRVADLPTFQHVLASLVLDRDPFRARARAVLVPSRAAAGQLRNTLEAHLVESGEGRDAACVLPDLVTRAEWYDQLHGRLRAAPPLLSAFEREVVMETSAREAAARGAPPPFHLRPGLIVEIARLYDELHRVRRSVARFSDLLIGDLSADAETDHGAARLLEQTRFLTSTFEAYEARLSALQRLDEHRLRQWLLEHPARTPYTHVVVAIADRAAEPEGLWPADFDLLTRLPLLERIDVVATESLLAAGFHERVHQMLPGIEEARSPGEPVRAPRLLVPAGRQERHVTSRDREDELLAIAKRLKEPGDGDRRLSRTAIVFKRPLPYIYLAREVFDSAGIPYQTRDALPLAAEPYAAAIDLVLDAVSSGFSRAPLVALLRSPHFVLAKDDRPFGPRAIGSFDRRLAGAGYLGGLESLRGLVEAAAGSGASVEADVARGAYAVAEELAPLLDAAPASSHLERLSSFLRGHVRSLPDDDPLRERQLRARAAIQTALELLRDAHRLIDDSPIGLPELVATVRRWIESQTFAPRAGSGGVHLVDAQAARFGLFDTVHLVGLVETEWPDRPSRHIFYPPFLLQQLGWPPESHRLSAARAAFRDLLRLARRHVAVSTFSLEDDAIVGPSVFLEDLERDEVELEPVFPGGHSRVCAQEALSEAPTSAAPLSGAAIEWLALRRSRSDAAAPRFHGEAGAHERLSYSVGSLETYLECPFKFFAKHVLRLEEELDDEEARRPLVQGTFLHRVFQRFFEAWGEAGRGSITLDSLEDARDVFARAVEPLLHELPEAEAALERGRLFGSAAAEGLAEIVFRVEAERGGDVVERLLEYPLEGEFEMRGPDGPRRIALTGVADRIDLLADGTLRVIDYKSGRPPSARRMLQLPIYTVCATQQLDGRHGRAWEPGEGGYIAFRDARRFVALDDRRGALREAQERLLTAVDGIRAGRFPPAPVEPFRCSFCSYAGVCRKDYVGDE
jgi:RecB family exonuclease